MLLHRYRNPELGLEVEFEENILIEMLNECRSYGKYETGGILAGYYDDSLKKAVIVRGSIAPKDSRHMHTRFHRGIKGLKSWLKEKWDEEKAYYLGEWHFHPFSSSGGDPNNAYSVSITVFNSNGGSVVLTEHTIEYL
jgi:hypothetical protein